MPTKRKAPLPPVPGVGQTPEQLCPICFPAGLDGTPEGATVVSCAHGAWRVEDLGQEPETPKDPEVPVNPAQTQEPKDPAQSEGNQQP
jgi:hypothetical protein